MRELEAKKEMVDQRAKMKECQEEYDSMHREWEELGSQLRDMNITMAPATQDSTALVPAGNLDI